MGKRILKASVYGSVGLCFFLALLSYLLITSWGRSFILNQLTSYLSSRYSIEVNYTQAHLETLSKISLHGLIIEGKDNSEFGIFKFDFEKIELGIQIDQYWPLKIIVSHFILYRPHLTGELKLLTSEKSQKSSSSPLPIQVKLQSFELQDLTTDLKLYNESFFIHLKTNTAQLRFNGDLTPDKLITAKLQIELPKLPSQWISIIKFPRQINETKIVSDFDGFLELDFTNKSQKNKSEIGLNISKIDFYFKNIEYTKDLINIKIKDHQLVGNFKAQGDFQFTNSELTESHLSLHKLDSTISSIIQKIDINHQNLTTIQKIQIDFLSQKYSKGMKADFTIQINNLIDSSFSLKPQTFNWTAFFEMEENLKKFTMNSQLNISNHKIFNNQILGNWDDGFNWAQSGVFQISDDFLKLNHRFPIKKSIEMEFISEGHLKVPGEHFLKASWNKSHLSPLKGFIKINIPLLDLGKFKALNFLTRIDYSGIKESSIKVQSESKLSSLYFPAHQIELLDFKFDIELLKELIQGEINLQMGKVKSQYIKKSIPIEIQGLVKTSMDQKNIDFKGDVLANQNRVFEFTVNSKLANTKKILDLNFKTNSIGFNDFYLYDILGECELNGMAKLVVHDNKPDSPIQFEAQSFLKQLTPKSDMRWSYPLEIKLNINKTAQELQSTFKVSLEDLRFDKNISLSHLDLEFNAYTKSKSNYEIMLNGQVSQIKIEDSINGTSHTFNNGLIDLKAKVMNDLKVNLEKFNISLNPTLLNIQSFGKGDLGKRKFNLFSNIIIDFPHQAMLIPGHLMSGHLVLPLNINLNEDGQLLLNGKIIFNNWNWHFSSYGLDRINGVFEFDELLSVKEKSWQDLLTPPAFERVDFEMVEPFIQNSEPLRIESVQFEEKQYGPFLGFPSLEQNIFSLHSIDFELNGGQLNGELFFDLNPKNRSLGLLARISDVQLSEVLPERLKKIRGSKSKEMSARMALYLDLKNRMLNGRIDFTEIGADQLITLINIVDPDYSDAQFNNIRQALAIANPTLIELDLENGYMDMNLELSGAVKMNFFIPSIPISGLTVEQVEKIEALFENDIDNAIEKENE